MASQADITQASVDSFSNTPDPRLLQLTQALVRHLHACVAEVCPTQEEWESAIGYLTRVGHTCQGSRQEFILLSDVLGISMLVDALNAPSKEQVTESTVLGPFYVEHPPLAEQGGDIAAGVEGGEPLWINVQATDTEGCPIAGAIVDIWQCAADGLYDVQRDLPEDEHELRARFIADAEGRVQCWSIMPVAYQIPSDGPVGELLAATGRHPWRPAHVHFRITADGHTTLATHVFPARSEYLDSDAVFGVKPSLIAEMPVHEPGPAPADRHTDRPWHTLTFHFALERSG
jgi:hydroxyquinol 1,2-dioxygenase